MIKIIINLILMINLSFALFLPFSLNINKTDIYYNIYNSNNKNKHNLNYYLQIRNYFLKNICNYKNKQKFLQCIDKYKLYYIPLNSKIVNRNNIVNFCKVYKPKNVLNCSIKRIQLLNLF